jgi:hypothetical protein
MKATCTALLLLALALPTSAGAEVVNAQRDLTVATAYWGRSTCSTITVESSPITWTVYAANGEVIPDEHVWASTDINGCVMTLAPSLWAETAPSPMPGFQSHWEGVVCEVIVHEFGHTLGLGDSAEAGIMNADPEDRPHIAACYPTTTAVATQAPAKPHKKRKQHHHA